MEPSLTDTLCTSCGLCCDGTLFADVELAGRAETSRIEILGLEIDDDSDAALMVLPCRALHGTRCSVYAHRPKCCRTFECHLLQSARRGAVSVEQAAQEIATTLIQVSQVKTLLAQLGQRDANLPLAERCAEALAPDQAGDAEARRMRAELESAMKAVEASIRATFLGGEVASTARPASRGR